MKNKIAIIGISLKVTGADNPDAFWASIEKGEACFHPLSAIRQQDLFSRFGEFQVAKGAYLDRIDLFDNEFFRLPAAEAERMDPEQRLMLEYAVKAVNNAGYLPADLKGQRIGIFHTFGQSMYRRFFDDFNNLSITAHMPGMVGTRVANYMDWRGPVLGIDTTCSSSLTALYNACQSIAVGDCSMALVASVSLSVTSRELAAYSPVMSRREECMPFDKDADGTLGGEGIVCMLLKKADDAIADGDPIYGIIRGGAINHGGALIQNISAPSPVAQAEVIKMAWQNSDVLPEQIRFIEAHGTGTILGDPIEFGGIDAAFSGEVEAGKKTCAISSVKGQLGHLGPVAGLIGLARLVLAIKNRKIPNQIGFKSINTHINESASSVSIQRELQYWESEQPRVGGVSSFGLTGTNVHMVVEEFPAINDNISDTGTGATYAMTLGGTNAARTARIAAYLQEYLHAFPDVALDRLCYSVNKILAPVPFAKLVLFKDRQQLLAILQEQVFTTPGQTQSQQVILLIPGLLQPEQLRSFPGYNDLQIRCRKELETLPHLSLSPEQSMLLEHYCAVRMMQEAGIVADKIVGAQGGKILSLLLTGRMQLEEALTGMDNTVQDPFNSEGFKKWLSSLDPLQQHLLLVTGTSGDMLTVCREWLKEQQDPSHIKIVLPQEQRDNCMDIAAAWYNDGRTLQTSLLLGKKMFLHNLHLPLMELKRFWPEVTSLVQSSVVAEKSTEEETNVQQYLTEEDLVAGVSTIWREKLKTDHVGPEDDFFDLGGSSLLGLDVIQQIEKRFEVSLEYADIFDYCTVMQQVGLIREKLADRLVPAAVQETPATAITDETAREHAYELLVEDIRKWKPTSVKMPERVLISGSTGFLGVYMIRTLLASTDARLYCLVRAGSDDEASVRLHETLQAYFPDLLWGHDRIHAVKGDITLPDLGLSPAARALLNNIDTVYHLAANVNHFGKAQFTERTNYDGTVHMLEWAKSNGVQRFNHLSTNAVASGGFIEHVAETAFYETDLDLGQQFGRRIYPASKFKAEQYIRDNKGHLNLNVFRTGNIGGDSTTGLFQRNIESSNFYQRVKALAGIGYYCDEIKGLLFETTPVDIVSKLVTQLSLQEHAPLDTFHIMEADPIRLDTFIQQLAQYNITLQHTDADNFMRQLEKLTAETELSSENAFLGILRYNSKDNSDTRFLIRQEATKALLDRIGVNIHYDIHRYADTIVQYCLKTGFIKQPDLQV